PPSAGPPVTVVPTSTEVGLSVAKGLPPFDPAVPAPPQAAPARGPYPTLHSRHKPHPLAETAPTGHSLAAIVAALPFRGSAAGALVLATPPLTAMQYVPLRFALQHQPQAQVMSAYGLIGDHVLSALLDHWQKLRERDPAVRAELDQAVVEFVGYVFNRRPA